jgi:hypothetical protein
VHYSESRRNVGFSFLPFLSAGIFGGLAERKQNKENSANSASAVKTMIRQYGLKEIITCILKK